MITRVDDFSRYKWVKCVCTKDQIAGVVRDWIVMMQRSLNKKLRVFKTDNGSEFFRLKEFFQQEGIRYDTSTQYTPQRNGIVECTAYLYHI